MTNLGQNWLCYDGIKYSVGRRDACYDGGITNLGQNWLFFCRSMTFLGQDWLCSDWIEHSVRQNRCTLLIIMCIIYVPKGAKTGILEV